MHPVSPMDQSPTLKEINGTEKQPLEENGINYKMENIKHEKQLLATANSENDTSDKIALPVEMAGMVPLRTLIGKMINKAHADLMTLTDTLPPMSDTERRRQILYYTTSTRMQFLKLLTLVKWAKNAEDIQMCQNIMAFLSNQNQVFQETVNYLHKNHTDLPRARVREFDIKTAIDILTTGTYQRMPTKFQDMLPPSPLTDKDVLETFEKLNDVLRVRMLTTEALPSPMRKYRIENGRVYFSVENEFNVALTLMGKSDERKWWIVYLDILVHPAVGGSAADVDISLNDYQKQRLRANAQRQLVPPTSQTTENESSITDSNSNTNINISITNPSNESSSSTPLFFPLINLYDYLHLFCLNMQLEIIYMQATMMAKTLWLDQLKIHMDSNRSNLTLVYWGGGSPAAQWGCPQIKDQDDVQLKSRSTSIEISISNIDHKQKGPLSTNNDLRSAVRDELKGLIQKSGIGVSVSLANLSDIDKVKVYSSLKYPKTCLEVNWCGSSNLHTDKVLLDSSNLTVERLLLHITQHHKQSILKKLHKLLKSQTSFLAENGVFLIENDDVNEDEGVNSMEDDKDYEQPLIIQYRHDLCINIDFDSRTGRIKVSETSRSDSDGDEVRLRGLEDRVNSDPTNISRHLVWLRSEVVFHEIVSLAKQLNLQAFHPSQMLLRSEDMVKLFGDLPTTLPDPSEVQENNKNIQSSTSRRLTNEQSQQSSKKPLYPRHCAFLQFSQYEDWYLVIAVIRNEFQASLCCLKKTNDQNTIYQEFMDIIHVDYEQLWKERFIYGRNNSDNLELDLEVNQNDNNDKSNESTSTNRPSKRRKTMNEFELSELTEARNKVDNLSVDLPFLAKLESLSRAFITNRKIESQLQQYRNIHSTTRPFMKSLSKKEACAINHPSADRMEVVCVSQRDILRTCAARNVDAVFGPGANNNATPRSEMLAWAETLLPKINNEVLMRASGWWSRHKSQCYIEILDKVDWKNIPLKTNEISDHIILDVDTNVLSFTYKDIDSCIDKFLIDWERIFMMANLSRQVSSVWFKKYNDQLSFELCNMQTLTFTYAMDFICTIRWDSPSKGRSRRYIIELGMAGKKTTSEKFSIPLSTKRNPHLRVITFLQDILNDKRDLVYFIQTLFQTLSLMAILDQLEVDCAQNGRIGQISIIPRSSESIRVIFSTSTLQGIDIQFKDPSTLCISDAAFHHVFNMPKFMPPQPFIPSSSTPAVTENDQNNSNNTISPIKVAQQMNCIQFTYFDDALNDVENWIFNSLDDQEMNDLDNKNQSWYLSGKTSIDSSEPVAVPFDHGLFCSVSLCKNVLFKLQQFFNH